MNGDGLGQLRSPLFTHAPWQEGGEVGGRVSSQEGAGVEVFLQPMTRVELPEFEGLKQRKPLLQNNMTNLIR